MSEDERLFIQVLQDNIARMNNNSIQCKTWCIALDAAILAMIANGSNCVLILVAIGITIGFYFLDCSYLRLEKNFRCFEKRFVETIQKKKSTRKLLFDYNDKTLEIRKTNWMRKPTKTREMVIAKGQNWRDALLSWSTLTVYLGILFSLLLILLFI